MARDSNPDDDPPAPKKRQRDEEEMTTSPGTFSADQVAELMKKMKSDKPTSPTRPTNRQPIRNIRRQYPLSNPEQSPPLPMPKGQPLSALRKSTAAPKASTYTPMQIACINEATRLLDIEITPEIIQSQQWFGYLSTNVGLTDLNLVLEGNGLQPSPRDCRKGVQELMR